MDIKQIRKNKNLKQDEFANELGIPVGTIRNWEQGRSKMPKYMEVVLDSKYGINLSTIEFINLLNRLAKQSLNGFKEWNKTAIEDVYKYVVYDKDNKNRVVLDACMNNKKKEIISYFDGIYGDTIHKDYDVNVIKEGKKSCVIVLLRKEKVSFIIADGEWNITTGLY